MLITITKLWDKQFEIIWDLYSKNSDRTLFTSSLYQFHDTM